MANLSVDDQGLHVELSPFEHAAGLLRNLDVPLHAIRAVYPVGEPLTATRGMRVGLGVPGRIKVGTWRAPGNKQFVVARRGEPGVLVEFDSDAIGYDEAVLSAENAGSLLEAFDARRADVRD